MKNNDSEMEKLCIFGSIRARRGAELKVTPIKTPSTFTSIVLLYPLFIFDRDVCGETVQMSKL